MFTYKKNLVSLVLALFVVFLSICAKASEKRDLDCITLLSIAGDKSKASGETQKYEKLVKLKKTLKSKYPLDHFSKDEITSSTADHNKLIMEKGNRYVNKWLQRCGLK